MNGQPNDKPRSEERIVLNKIDRCLRTDDGLTLISQIHYYIQIAQNQLKTSRDLLDIGRYQGKIEAWETILKLREEK